MKQTSLPVISGKALIDLRNRLINQFFLLKKSEKEGDIFLCYDKIEILLQFFIPIMNEANPRKGFADKIIEAIFECHPTYSNMYRLVIFASKKYKEKIMVAIVKRGLMNDVEKTLPYIKRSITKEELQKLAVKNFSHEASYKKVLSLASVFYPEMVEELNQKYSINHDLHETYSGLV